MGNPTAVSSSKSLDHFFFLLIASLLLVSFLNNGVAAARKLLSSESHEFHTIKLSSILPDSVCDSSSQGHKLPSPSSLKVVHKYGPCHETKESAMPSALELLAADESRVKSINSRIGLNAAQTTLDSTESAVTLPAKLGLGSSNYFVKVGLGTPKKDFSLMFDTGSDFTWTQCEPCSRSCYDQAEPIFDRSKSSTYTNVSCNTPECDKLKSATKNKAGCTKSGTNCVYGVKYADKSYSAGYLGKETLTLTTTEVIPSFYFGCGQNNKGRFGQLAGLMGLGRDPLSIVQQTLEKYGQIFSYCLPSTSSKTGFLTFGKSSVSNSVHYTPFNTSLATTAYYIDILAMYVGGQKLQISPTVFSTAGSVIDSGTIITRLPLPAYTALRDEFRKQMTSYPLVNPFSLLDTCYDFSSYNTMKIPTISIVFGGDTKIDLDDSGIMYTIDSSKVCLAFAPNSEASDILLLGSVQQRTMQVVYDVAGGKLGFAPKGCA